MSSLMSPIKDLIKKLYQFFTAFGKLKDIFLVSEILKKHLQLFKGML